MSISDDDLARLLAGEPTPAQPTPDHGNLTDRTLAEQLVERHGHNLRYVHPWGRWLVWDGNRWQPDDLGQTEHAAKQILRTLLAKAAEIDDDKERGRRIREIVAAEKANRIRGCLELARSEPGIPILPDQLDQKPWYLNVANGTVDLETGALTEAKRADLLTKQALTEYDPDAEAPRWDAFLNRVLPDPAVRGFLQRAAGYSLVAGNPEQIILILWGAGANGKSTFLEILRALLGDYGQQAPPETFLAKHDGIPNDVARLRGARLVAATETGEGRRLNEALIKQMTGGDTMTARFLRQEYFEFQPQFTPWLATNHKPEIRGTDEAIWRRIRLVPFTETIPLAERDPFLKDKLRDELPGILGWALAGTADWKADGLAEPEAVRAATRDYREDQDDLGRFLADRCQTDEGATARTSDLYNSYNDWAKAQGEQPMTANALGRRLSDRGYKQVRPGGKRHWEGIRLDSEQQEIA